MVVAGTWGRGVEKVGDVGQSIQSFNYKKKKFCRPNVQYYNYS